MHIVGWPAFSNAHLQPYNSLLYRAVQQLGHDVSEFSVGMLCRRQPADLLHVHWPDAAFNAPSAAVAIRRAVKVLGSVELARSRGCKVVWTVHNLGAHDGHHPQLQRRFFARFTERLSGVVALSASSLVAAVERYPALGRIPHVVTPHGHYADAYPHVPSRLDARRSLGLPDHDGVALFLGQIRPYKNVVQLIEAFRGVSRPDASLVVAGHPTDALRQKIVHAAAADSRVRVDLRVLPDAAIPALVAASSVAVLPYRDVLNSGAALLALSLGRPVLVPERGSMGELRRAFGDLWVRTYEGEISARIIATALEWAEHERPERPDLTPLSWPSIAARTVEFFQSVAECNAN